MQTFVKKISFFLLCNILWEAPPVLMDPPPRGSWVGRVALYSGASLLPVTQVGIRIISHHWHPASFWHRHHRHQGVKQGGIRHSWHCRARTGDTRRQLTGKDDKRFEAWRELDISIHPYSHQYQWHSQSALPPWRLDYLLPWIRHLGVLWTCFL